MTTPPEPTRLPAPPPTWRAKLRKFVWPDWSQRRKMLRVEAWAVVFASYALLAFAYLWAQDYRNTSTAYVAASWLAILVRSLQFHLGLLLLVIALAAAFGRGRRLFLAAAPPLLFTLVPALVQYWPKSVPQPPAQARPLRVMTVNLLMVNQQTDAMIGEIRAADPDVLLLQEYSGHWDEALQDALGVAYPHQSSVVQEDSFGAAVYSKTPFIGEVEQYLPLAHDACPQFRAVVKHEGREVALYNIHLLPPRTMDYTLQHRLQFADMVETLKFERLPYVLAGDFNFPETAPQHHHLLKSTDVREAHDLAGHGRGATWPVNGPFRYIPGLRFDHVYLSRGLTATHCETGTGRGSDHRPVVVDVTFERVGDQ